MKKNVGTIDKVIRIIAAIVLVVLFFTHTVKGIPGIILLIIAGLLVVTSLVGFCPLYTILGIKTCPGKK